jgi:hypothetical protein
MVLVARKGRSGAAFSVSDDFLCEVYCNDLNLQAKIQFMVNKMSLQEEWISNV